MGRATAARHVVTTPPALTEDSSTSPPAVRDYVASFARPNDVRACASVAISFALYVLMFYTPWYCVPLQAMVIMRLFIVCVHDAAHGSLYSRGWANALVGSVAAPLTGFTYHYWQWGHNYHHEHSNDLDYEQWSQTAPVTVAQFRAFPAWKRRAYRFFMVPLALLAAGAPFAIVLLQPLAADTALDWALQLAWWGALAWRGCLLRYVAAVTLAARKLCARPGQPMRQTRHEKGTLTPNLHSTWTLTKTALGLFLFHSQHTFEDCVREHGRTATSEGYYANAMEGSSLMVVPRWMKFFTAGIEYHHIHHLNAKVASYSLQACHDNVSPAARA